MSGLALTPSPTSLTYTWTDGRTVTTVDRAAVSDPRERAVSRALLVHALHLIDEEDAR